MILARGGFFARSLGEPDDPRDRVRRNLERLLNTRRRTRPTEEEWPAETLAAYGIPDLDGFDATTLASRQRLSAVVTKLIAAWEPRLTGVSVTALEDANGPVQAIRLRIDARWSAGPIGFSAVWKHGAPLTLDEHDSDLT